MSEMSEAEVLAEFRAAGALLTGHFVLTSGLHSPFYLQCARVLMDPARAGRLVAALAPRVAPTAPDLVVAPALGGIVLGYELGRQLGCRSLFVERVDGSFTLRRGFEIPPGSRIVIAEDVITTGLSTRECVACCIAAGGEVVAVACLVSGGSSIRTCGGLPECRPRSCTRSRRAREPARDPRPQDRTGIARS